MGTAIYGAWLGGFAPPAAAAAAAAPPPVGRLLTLEEVGAIFGGASPSPPFPSSPPLPPTPKPSPTDTSSLTARGRRAAPTNLKDRDAFHLTIEEYLLALIDLTQDLSRLAPNAVTLGDFDLPMVIAAFVKNLFAGFQLLNLKNDILRKRADAVKYDVKRVEDVVYDLSLRGLVARPHPHAEAEG